MTGFDFDLVLGEKKKNKKRENVQFRITEEMLARWKSFVIKNSQVGSISKLIRTAVNQFIEFHTKYAELKVPVVFQKIFNDNWKNYRRIRLFEENMKDRYYKFIPEESSLFENIEDLQFFQIMSNILTQKIYEKIRENQKLKDIVAKAKANTYV